jgi:hypothetical protein
MYDIRRSRWTWKSNDQRESSSTEVLSFGGYINIVKLIEINFFLINGLEKIFYTRILSNHLNKFIINTLRPTFFVSNILFEKKETIHEKTIDQKYLSFGFAIYEYFTYLSISQNEK